MSKLLVDEISDVDNTGPVTVTDGAVVNRTGDGTIIDLQAGGTTVGSIGTSASNLTIGTSTNGLRFDAAGDSIHSWNITANAEINGGRDLGKSNSRFKDLYLSGGVYLGGTGAANHLDDYEEGLWYPAVGSGMTTAAGTPTYSGAYTKVGNIVNVYFRQSGGTLNLSATGYATGLPFEPSGSPALAYVGSATNSGPAIVGVCLPWVGGALYFHLDAVYNSTDFIMSVSYRTA
jgi:hypothetical protein